MSETAFDRLRMNFARVGRVDWIGLREARDIPMRVVDAAEAKSGAGLIGDRYASGSGKRGVTLIQAEHLPVIAAFTGHTRIDPGTLRRNVVISGIPLSALIGQRFRLGEVLLEATGTCDPCERMERALGVGGYNAMSGHSGICARILEGGWIRVGDALTAVHSESV